MRKSNQLRRAGVLLHITSLPSKEGIGTLGSSAFAFCDWLKKAGLTLWQVLPLGPTGYGDSPYASFSTFAGNPLLIDLQSLHECGWAEKRAIKVPAYIKAKGSVDYGSVVWWKLPVLYECASYFLRNASRSDRNAFLSFCRKNDFWLTDFALFTSIKNFYDKKASEEKVYGESSRWNSYWPRELARHEEKALVLWEKNHHEEIECIKAVQFFFFTQWSKLKKHAKKNGISFIGDIPIFVAGDSADVWSNRKLFQVCQRTLLQKSCAGVPPDYFSATGQLWGNPLYDWKKMKDDGYSWWISRIRHMMSLTDIVRIDHFRGFEAYWKVPYGEKTAVNGKWTKGPGKELFDCIKKALPEVQVIAEDLGVITEKVERLRDGCSFPGMKILQFAFNDCPWNEESARNLYLPENFKDENCVVYTGTHDNNTTAGTLEESPIQYRWNVCDYLGLKDTADVKKITYSLISCALSSRAKYCIIPVQDFLCTGSEGRMNTPSKASGNWSWRLLRLPSLSLAEKIRGLLSGCSRL